MAFRNQGGGKGREGREEAQETGLRVVLRVGYGRGRQVGCWKGMDGLTGGGVRS